MEIYVFSDCFRNCQVMVYKKADKIIPKSHLENYVVGTVGVGEGVEGEEGRGRTLKNVYCQS